MQELAFLRHEVYPFGYRTQPLSPACDNGLPPFTFLQLAWEKPERGLKQRSGLTERRWRGGPRHEAAEPIHALDFSTCRVQMIV